MTRTRYLKLSLSDRESALSELYRHNLQRLHDALSFCQQNKIQLYRMSSNLFPLSDLEDKIGANILEAMSADLAAIGQRANALNIRMVLHPEQYVVLSSDSPEVVQASIKNLAGRARILDLLSLPRRREAACRQTSPWIEVEAKQKEEAMPSASFANAKVRSCWLNEK